MKPVDGRQLRAARAVLGWTVKEAATAAKVHRNTVCRTEAFETLPAYAHAADAMAAAYRSAGIVFGRSDGGPSIAFAAPLARFRWKDRERVRRPQAPKSPEPEMARSNLMGAG